VKIAYLLPNLHITGGARVGVEIGARMVARGHEFNILIPRGRQKLPSPDGVRIIECGVQVGSPLLVVAAGLMGMLISLPPVDIIIASMPTHALLAQFMGKLRRIPAVNYALNDDVNFFNDRTFIHSRLLLKVYRTIARAAIKPNYLLTNSHWTAVQCVSEGGRRPFSIVHSGYNQDLFFPAINRADNSPLRIVTVGRRPRWKGLSDLIDALNLIDLKSHPFTLTIITQDKLDLSQADFPFEIIKPKGDAELVIQYQRGDIFVHPSWFEGFGLPPLESLACGLPVVSTNCGGVREFLTDGINALIVPPRDPSALSKAITTLLENSELRAELASAGLETCKNFTWDKITDQFEVTLGKILAAYKQ